MHALAYLYDNLCEFPAWFQRLTPIQMAIVKTIQPGGFMRQPQWQGKDQKPPAILPLDEMERREFIRALIAFSGDVSAAAKALEIGKTTFYRRSKEWGFTAADWRRVYQAASLAHPLRVRSPHLKASSGTASF